MEPLTMISAGASALGGIMGFKGNQAAAQAAQQTAEYNAKVAENEAVLLRRAKVAEEASFRQQSDRFIATQRVATAKSGVQMSGSPLQALFDSYYNANMDVVKIQYAGDVEEAGKVADAALSRASGRARATALKTQSYQSLLSGAGKAANILA